MDRRTGNARYGPLRPVGRLRSDGTWKCCQACIGRRSRVVTASKRNSHDVPRNPVIRRISRADDFQNCKMPRRCAAAHGDQGDIPVPPGHHATGQTWEIGSMGSMASTWPAPSEDFSIASKPPIASSIFTQASLAPSKRLSLILQVTLSCVRQFFLAAMVRPGAGSF